MKTKKSEREHTAEEILEAARRDARPTSKTARRWMERHGQQLMPAYQEWPLQAPRGAERA